jgi:tight adherence protein C
MLELLTVVVFVLVAAGTAAPGVYFAMRRQREVERLSATATTVPRTLPSYVLAWRELVARIGSAVPASSKNLPRLKRRLIRAGFRSPDATRYFQGFRTVSTVLCGALALGLACRSHSEIDNLALATGAALALGYMAPMQYLQIRIRRRQHGIERGLPNALDLMVVCVESGLGLDQTTIQVAKELQSAHPEISEEFTVMNLELRAGERRADALHNLADRAGVEDLKKLVAVLIQTDRFGTSIAQSLRGHADYLRTMARQKAEEKASKLAVKLVFPIFFCVLPSLFVVTVGPVLTRLVRDLLPMIENM